MLTHKGTKRIQTSRLILRLLTEADAEAMYLWCSDEHVTKYMTSPTYTDIETLKVWLRTVPYHSGYPFGFVRKSDGTLIGSGDIGERSDDGFWEFGYNFRYDCWGKGYATEAAKAMIAYVYEHFGARKFRATHAVENKASGHVMEKCGLKFVRFGEYEKIDGSAKFKSMIYECEMP